MLPFKKLEISSLSLCPELKSYFEGRSNNREAEEFAIVFNRKAIDLIETFNYSWHLYLSFKNKKILKGLFRT